ncbi:hypothetical protein [Marinobacter sp. X15-166B]|uniref:hypothetical protein n=1 Tax=Marinobacter sp. X15-166B TaxID=1897620 RepID=UPI0018EA07AE|nr:hypothetical protein [Marinobacter sp. X15-166B]
MFDLPHPFGPTTAVRFVGNRTVVASTNDLNPASFIDFKRIVGLSAQITGLRLLRTLPRGAQFNTGRHFFGEVNPQVNLNITTN